MSLLYWSEAPKGDEIEKLPVTTEHVGCVIATTGAVGFDGIGFTRNVDATETQPVAVFLTMMLYVFGASDPKVTPV